LEVKPANQLSTGNFVLLAMPNSQSRNSPSTAALGPIPFGLVPNKGSLPTSVHHRGCSLQKAKERSGDYDNNYNDFFHYHPQRPKIE
jgi:hypothetical protein